MSATLMMLMGLCCGDCGAEKEACISEIFRLRTRGEFYVADDVNRLRPRMAVIMTLGSSDILAYQERNKIKGPIDYYRFAALFAQLCEEKGTRDSAVAGFKGSPPGKVKLVWAAVLKENGVKDGAVDAYINDAVKDACLNDFWIEINVKPRKNVDGR